MIRIISVSLLVLLLPVVFVEAQAGSNPNLYVSAENSKFDNHFAGSMVIEVVVNDQNIRDTDEGKGEPDVTINGKQLRMVQGSDGQWYAYFAHVDQAQTADQIVFNAGAGAEGKSLDFGVFCGANTAPGVLGDGTGTGNQLDFSESRGVAIPRQGGIMGATNGDASFNACTGSPISSPLLNNVVREPRSINTNPSVPSGQIGLNPNAWPIIQLFSFNEVTIQYNRGGGPQSVHLEYDEIPNIKTELDRSGYPQGAEVFVTITDMQLNQDPTDEDSWTMKIAPPVATFYQAFNENGIDSANNSPGLINLVPHLSSLDFEDNGIFSMSLGNVVQLQTNDIQPDISVTDGNTYPQIVTFVESAPNSGIFENFDDSNKSTMRISPNAPRGQSATISYNDQSKSIVSGTFAASVSLGDRQEFEPGEKSQISVTDPDQNINTGARDHLDVFRSSALIPTLKIGDPVTLENANTFKIYPQSTTALNMGTTVPSSVPDPNSARLIVDTTGIMIPTDVEKISLNLGINAGQLQSILIDDSLANHAGTNWINFDLRSFEQQLDIASFSDTTMTLHFGGLPGATTVQILDPGDTSSAKNFVELDDPDVATIQSVSSSSSVFLVINFDSSNNTPSAGKVSGEINTQPIVFDIFSFGQIEDADLNNAIYRFELEETSSNSGIFTGTVEYSIANQLTVFDSQFIKSKLRTIDDQIHFFVTNRLVDEEGINIQYSDVEVGVTIGKSEKADIRTTSGTVSVKSKTYRFGQPVTIVLNDPDLNTDHDEIDIYNVIDDPNSPNVDTVGTDGGAILLEILIKDIRYKRCTINGVQTGGLASTGFSLVETGPSTGIFEGTFQIPTQICNKDGTKLITTAGGSLDAKYHDFRDASGGQNIFSLTTSPTTSAQSSPPTLNSEKFVLPERGQTSQVVLSGKIGNYRPGVTLELALVGPDKAAQTLRVTPTSQGQYRAEITLDDKSKTGTYTINVNYRNSLQGIVSFEVVKKPVPQWVKNNAQWWSTNQISENEFIRGIEYLIEENIINVPESVTTKTQIPDVPVWIKNTAEWWSEGLVTDDEFLSALEYLVKNGIIRI